MKFNRERAQQDLSEHQEWLYDVIIAELEWRWRQDIRQAPWHACSCALCFSPFPTEHPGYDCDDEDDDPPASRPDGRPISRNPPKHSPYEQPEQQ